MRHITPLVYAPFSTPCLSISLNTVWSIDDMLIGFFSSSPSLLGFGSLQDFQNSYVIPLYPGHLPAWDCFSASFISSSDVSASSSFDSSPLSLSFICFFSFSLLPLSLSGPLGDFLGAIRGIWRQCLPSFWFLSGLPPPHLVVLALYLLVLLAYLRRTSTWSIAPLHL